jgi:hypothetical protein
MSYHPWLYFLSLEKDFILTLDYVELDAANAKTFSNEYAKLILLLGSEVDVVAKLLCDEIDPANKAANINDYRSIITTAFPGMHSVQIDIQRYRMANQPWLSWDPAQFQNPSWWKAYNDLKHERDKNFSDANQENVVSALCGLMVLLLYLFRKESHVQPYPELLGYDFPQYLVSEAEGKKLPGA